MQEGEQQRLMTTDTHIWETVLLYGSRLIDGRRVC